MALFFPWATKEYLLWEMTIGQIILYHNMALDIRSGKANEPEGLANKPLDELRALRDEAIRIDEQQRAAELKRELSNKYGAI